MGCVLRRFGSRNKLDGDELAAGYWHSLALLAECETSTATCDGPVLFTVADRAISDAGRVALWTKADSVTCFGASVVRILPCLTSPKSQ